MWTKEVIGIGIINAEGISQFLHIINKKLSDVIEREAKQMLISTASKVRNSQKGNVIWNLNIKSETPLAFRESTAYSGLKPEIYCNIVADSTNEWNFEKCDIVIRIWSVCEKINYREKLDSQFIRDNIQENNNQRVIFRCHFDKARVTGEPLFHLQYGGTQKGKLINGSKLIKEYYWHPNIPVPRIPFPPIDLVLAVEIILENFFPRKFNELQSDYKWINMIKQSERMFLENYFKKCYETINHSSETIYRTLRS